ncbi:MAG: hypothetical protein A2Y62_01780 [Candidatus Fischerbacteria bacterium RBG_13_37_8]|uniref:HEPN domain-containing protein n=1 Tax=Candidatus Fischerbacteria bacterium RBG_13_37_8 TaxID=1817863 RepID=A0A1F5VDP0_9BACT|nr:MAG: hypothetical protein A2Y62_01780 [Candidatus Fischerbacteria bacterium RBG_13_37_8]
MTIKEKQIELAKYRLKQAEESLTEALFLLAGKQSPRSIMNRAYYSMFYAVLSLMVFETFSSSKHSGVLSYFNKRFIKERTFAEELGRSINKAFELRQEGDYREYTELNYEDVEPFISQAQTFLNAVKEFLERKHFN